MSKSRTSLRSIPAVEKVWQALGPIALPRAAVIAVIRRELNGLRKVKSVPGFEDILQGIGQALVALEESRLQPLINGTGILLHTNLGRAPLGESTIAALNAIAANYNNLEFDLASGERGGRAGYLENNLALLCAAEAATVVNNCAAALLLALRYFTKRRQEVVISRGELVQIGGGFRIPDVLEASGAKLREVGTTNKTALSDYEKAIGKDTGLILKVHRSNFYMAGFVESPAAESIAELAGRKRIPFLEDLGSGAAVPTDQIASLEHEPTPAEALKRGAHLVTFSGDKLLGGPQAGIIAGQARWIAGLKREPFYRALRCDKLVLAGLQATVDDYLQGNPERTIPILTMIQTTEAELRKRAERIVAAVQGGNLRLSIGQGRAQIGGGTLPRSQLPSITVDIVAEGLPLAELAARLRKGPLPIIGYVSGGRFRIDLRTVFPAQDDSLIHGLQSRLAAKTGA